MFFKIHAPRGERSDQGIVAASVVAENDRPLPLAGLAPPRVLGVWPELPPRPPQIGAEVVDEPERDESVRGRREAEPAVGIPALGELPGDLDEVAERILAPRPVEVLIVSSEAVTERLLAERFDVDAMEDQAAVEQAAHRASAHVLAATIRE